MKFIEVLANFIITWTTFAILVAIYYFTWLGVLSGLSIGFNIHPVISFMVAVVLLQIFPSISSFVFTVLGIFLSQKYLDWSIWQTCIVYIPTTAISFIMILISCLISVWSTFLEIYRHLKGK